ncbi:MAG: hypothetical protein H7Y86_09430 [Rhizobacter sp.]|nr:hypothetical protein [Ferruginibacter sp.]
MKHTQSIYREQLLRLLSAATFIIFFQLYMIAPLIPALSDFFKVSEQKAYKWVRKEADRQ